MTINIERIDYYWKDIKLERNDTVITEHYVQVNGHAFLVHPESYIRLTEHLSQIYIKHL